MSSSLLRRYLLIPVLLSCAAVVPAQAAVIFSENFNSFNTLAGLNAAGWYYRNTASTGNGWNGNGGPAVVPAGIESSGIITGNALFNGGGSSVNTVVLKQFAPVTLSLLGDSVSVAFDSISTNTSATNGLFNVSLVNANNIVTENKLGPPNPIPSANGYGYLQSSTSTPATAGIYRITGNPTSITSADYTTSLLSSPAVSMTINDNVIHAYTFTLTKVATGLQITLVRDAVQIASYIDTTATGVLEFDTLRMGSINGSYIDNVVVSTAAIPEPTTAALLLGGLLGGGLMAYRRKR